MKTINKCKYEKAKVTKNFSQIPNNLNKNKEMSVYQKYFLSCVMQYDDFIGLSNKDISKIFSLSIAQIKRIKAELLLLGYLTKIDNGYLINIVKIENIEVAHTEPTINNDDSDRLLNSQDRLPQSLGVATTEPRGRLQQSLGVAIIEPSNTIGKPIYQEVTTPYNTTLPYYIDNTIDNTNLKDKKEEKEKKENFSKVEENVEDLNLISDGNLIPEQTKEIPTMTTYKNDNERLIKNGNSMVTVSSICNNPEFQPVEELDFQFGMTRLTVKRNEITRFLGGKINYDKDEYKDFIHLDIIQNSKISFIDFMYYTFIYLYMDGKNTIEKIQSVHGIGGIAEEVMNLRKEFDNDLIKIKMTKEEFIIKAFNIPNYLKIAS